MATASNGSNGFGSSVTGSDPTASATLGDGAAVLNYEDCDLNSITRSQMIQDLIAYRYDLEFCQTQLMTQEDLSPQELRTLQIRILDCAHNIRHCKHRIQVLDAQARLGIAPYSTGTVGGSGSGAGTYRLKGKHKRQRVDKIEGDEMDSTGVGSSYVKIAAAGGETDADADDSIVAAGIDTSFTTMGVSPGEATHTLQRLGYWDCRLCRSRKYLEAGSNRVPSAPVSNSLFALDTLPPPLLPN